MAQQPFAWFIAGPKGADEDHSAFVNKEEHIAPMLAHLCGLAGEAPGYFTTTALYTAVQPTVATK